MIMPNHDNIARAACRSPTTMAALGRQKRRCLPRQHLLQSSLMRRTLLSHTPSSSPGPALLSMMQVRMKRACIRPAKDHALRIVPMVLREPCSSSSTCAMCLVKFSYIALVQFLQWHKIQSIHPVKQCKSYPCTVLTGSRVILRSAPPLRILLQSPLLMNPLVASTLWLQGQHCWAYVTLLRIQKALCCRHTSLTEYTS